MAGQHPRLTQISTSSSHQAPSLRRSKGLVMKKPYTNTRAKVFAYNAGVLHRLLIRAGETTMPHFFARQCATMGGPILCLARALLAAPFGPSAMCFLRTSQCFGWHGPNINHGTRGTTLRHHHAQNPFETTPRACTVETTMLPSDAAALRPGGLRAGGRLKNGSCKMMTLPMRRSAAVPVGMCGDKLRQRATMKCKEFWNEVLIFPAKR